MGQRQTIYYDELISEVPDRHSNRAVVHRAPNNEVTINFRNMKIVLHTEDEIQEWKRGFTEALRALQEKDYLKDDL